MFSNTTKDSTEETEHAARDAANSAKKTIDSTRDDLRAKYKDSDAEGALHELAENVCDAAHKYTKQARKMYNSTSNSIEDTSDAVVREIRRNPFRSMMIALATGYVLASCRTKR